MLPELLKKRKTENLLVLSCWLGSLFLEPLNP